MAVFFLLLFRFVWLLLSGDQIVAVENAAVRMQSRFPAKRKRPLLTSWDWIFWVTLRNLWSDWREPLL